MTNVPQSLPAKLADRARRVLRSAARLRRLPSYMIGLGREAPEKREVVYVVEDANWSIHWDGVHITNGLNVLGRAAKIDTSPALYASKILHFGSAFVFEQRAFRGHSTKSKAAKNKIVMTFFHGKYGDDQAMDKRLDFVKDNIGRIDAIAVSTSIMKQRFSEMGIPPEKLFLVPIGVDLSVFHPPANTEEKQAARGALGIEGDRFVIGSFQKDGQGWGDGGKPKPEKGPDVFLDVIGRLAPKHKLHVLLSGPARGYVMQGLDQIGVPYTHRLFHHPDDVASFYRLLDAYLVASREEGGPKAILESLASGVPLVTTDVGMARDVMDGHECGLILAVDDHEGLTKAMETMIRDTALARRFVTNGLRRVQDFTWAKVAESCEDLYSTIESR